MLLEGRMIALRRVVLLVLATLFSIKIEGGLLDVVAKGNGGSGKLQVGYYWRTCPLAEIIVTEEVIRAVSTNPGLAAGLVRMHFHDCFVRGCDGSVLIDSTPKNVAEKDAPPNNPSLRGFEVVDKIKAKLELHCSRVVSCADILAFAARDSVLLTGGLYYNVPSGRKDGRISLATDTRSLPPPSFNLSQLTQNFANKGFTQEEMIILSGAHTIGRSHCTSFANRLYNFNSTVSQDPTLDPAYAAQLKRQCPQGSINQTVPMDPRTPSRMDTNYYSDILNKRGLFTSDQTLLTSPAAASIVKSNAGNWLSFQKKFAASMIKMGMIEVITGKDGEVRTNCRKIN